MDAEISGGRVVDNQETLPTLINKTENAYDMSIIVT